MDTTGNPPLCHELGCGKCVSARELFFLLPMLALLGDIYVAPAKHFTATAFFSCTSSHNPIIIRSKCQLIFCISKERNKENCVIQNFSAWTGEVESLS